MFWLFSTFSWVFQWTMYGSLFIIRFGCRSSITTGIYPYLNQRLIYYAQQEQLPRHTHTSQLIQAILISVCIRHGRGHRWLPVNWFPVQLKSCGRTRLCMLRAAAVGAQAQIRGLPGLGGGMRTADKLFPYSQTRTLCQRDRNVKEDSSVWLSSNCHSATDTIKSISACKWRPS